ncbi:MAG: hypothetical protein OXE57_01385 [Alphaproteobacteria bacterium]|nr:hypothetical protein [Alphaproteobacteria bacterium]
MTIPAFSRLAAVAITLCFTPGALALDVVDRLRQSGAVLHELGRVAGLEGYWVEPASGGGWPLYVTSTGHAIAGLLHDASGRLLTVDQIARLDAPGGDVSDALEHAAFRVGATGIDVVVFADPACSWSRATVARFAMAALEGHLVLHVVPVSVLGHDSAKMARAVISAGDPAAAWFVAARASHGGGEAELDANNRHFAGIGGRAVPLVTRADGTLHEGSISDPVAWLNGGTP